MKLKYNVTDAQGGAFEAPKPGLYDCRVQEMSMGKSKERDLPMLTVRLEVVAGEHKGAVLFERILTEDPATAWKLRQFTDAVQLPPAGELDIDNPAALPLLKARVKNETYNGERRAVVTSLLANTDNGSREALAKGLENLQVLADEDAAIEAAQEPEPVLPGAKGTQEPEEDDYDEWDLSDLKAELKERGLADTGRKSTLINRLRENDSADPFK